MERDFVIGIIGSFSGNSSAKPERFVEVDRDEFTTVFERMAPTLELGLPFCERLSLAEWDDWHPDGLLGRVPMLARLLEARDAASDPGRMRALLAEAGVTVAPEAAAEAGAGSEPQTVSESELLDDLLGGAKDRSEPVRVARHVADPSFERLVAEIAAPHAERIDHAGIASRREAIDGELGARTRSLLRHPVFSRCEALWRSLRALVFGSETGESLRIRILDADPNVLRDAAAGSELAELLHRLVVTDEHGTRGGQPFGLLLVDTELAGSEEDLVLLERVGRIAAEAELPCLLGAARTLWAKDAADAAQDFLAKARALPGAARIALCAPGALTREPYGRAGDPVDRFAFEEVDDGPGSEGYCWGAAGFVVAQAAADAVASAGSPAQTARFAQRDGLPFHPRSADGEPVGPTEQVLPDSELERLRESGLLPIAGVRGRDRAVLVSLGSLTGDSLF